MMRSKAAAYCLFVVILIASWNLAMADPPAATGPSTLPATAPAIVKMAPVEKDPGPPFAPFQPVESATHAESASITLRGIEVDLNDDAVTKSIHDQLKILSIEIDARLDESGKLLKADPSLQLLDAQQQDWLGISRELDQWKQSLQRRTDQLKSKQSLLAQSENTWEQEQRLCDYYSKKKKADALLRTAEIPIHKTLDAIGHTTDDLSATLLQLAELRQEVDLQAARVLEVTDSVQRAHDEAFSRLFMQNNPPLWKVSFRPRDNQGVIAQARESFDRQMRAVGAFISRHRENAAMQVLVLIVLASGLWWVRSRMQVWVAKDPRLDKPTRVFASPLSSALVIAIFFSGSIYPQPPRLFWAFMGAAALIPTVIILRRLIDRRWFAMLDALVVFYFLDQLRSIAAVVPELARLLLLFEMLGGFFLLMSFMRSIRKASISPRACKTIRGFTVVWMIVFLVASMGTVLGYVSLAALLGNGALGSAYLAVILYACTLILQGMVTVALRSRPFMMLQMVRQYQPVILSRITTGLDWLAIIAWGLGVMATVSVAGAAYAFTSKILSAQLTFGSLHLSLGDTLKFGLSIWASILLSRFLRFVLEKDVYERFALPSGIPYAISKLLNYVVLLIGFFVAVSALGYDMTKFTILAGAFGVGLGFGMQNIVNNFVSGLILLFERPVKVGDVIQMGDTTGVVVHIGIRASILRTHDSSEIIIPNGNLISAQVTNWTLSNRQRGIDFSMKLGADADPTKVMALLKSVAAANPRVAKSPAPEVFLADFGGDSFSYKMTAWTDSADQWIQIRSELSVALNRELVKEHIAIK